MRSIVILLMILWLSRIPGLEALPLHNDEGLHLTRAVEVWNLHPFWEIRDGKIINHWAIALFYPQNAPVFAGRIATVFVSMIGLAAGYALVRRRFGFHAALLAGAMWAASPYLFFFERLAFSDAEAGALVVLALWASWRLAERGTVQRAIFAGFAFGLAALFKFTAAPFALGVTLIVLLMPLAARVRYPVQQRFVLLVVVGATVALMFAPPVGYLALRGDALFSIAMGWIGGSGAQMGVSANLRMLAAQLTDFGAPVWSGLMVAGILLLVALRPRSGRLLALAVGVPLAVMIVLGREVLPRHFVVAMPALLLLGGAGIGVAIETLLKHQAQRRAGMAFATGLLAFGFVPLALNAYNAPEVNPYPKDVWTEHFSTHSAGYGLREAVLELPQTIQPAGTPVIASMTGDSCRRANFYAVDDMRLTCADAPGLNAIKAALETQSIVYVLVDQFTGIADVPSEAEALGITAEPLAVYTRPGADNERVTLWRLERAE